MKRFEFTWTEYHRTFIDAESMDEAYEKLNDGGEDGSEYMGSDNYECVEVKDE